MLACYREKNAKDIGKFVVLGTQVMFSTVKMKFSHFALQLVMDFL